jgi:hypothetical protein
VCLTSCSALSSVHLHVFNDMTCRSSLFHPPDRTDFRPVDWVTFQASLGDGILLNPDLHVELANNTCVGKLSSAILEALVVSTPKSRPFVNPRPLNPACIQKEIIMKYRLRRQWQMNRDPALNA